MALRLGFAVSTATPADIILMDEWLSVGDADFAVKAQMRLREQLSRSRVLVLASHSEKMVQENCNRIFHLEHGRLRELPVPAAFPPPLREN
jgi:lipopolysaccharide transport system ATP-binding protein